LTSKHHEGFTNWRSPQSWNWNSVDDGPHQDNVLLVGNAMRAVGLHFGLYFSLFEWFNPLYLADKATGGSSTVYVNTTMTPQLHDIVNTYLPEVIWSDGDWEMNDYYWGSRDFLAWLYNSSPVKDVVVTNDRWGAGDSCKHGGFWTCDDRYNPGHVLPHKWENCLTLDENSWGYRRNADVWNYMTIEDLLFQLASTVSCGGNMLLNAGPTSDGRIAPIMEERLLQIGSWLDINGPSIYYTMPWRVQNDTVASNVWYTAAKNGTAIYAIVLGYPAGGNLVLDAPIAGSGATVSILGYPGRVNWSFGPLLNVQFPSPAVMKSKWAWVLQLINFK